MSASQSATGPSVVQWRAGLAVKLREAMKERDPVAVAALRSLSARVANAEAVPVESMPRAGAIEGAALGVGAADAPRRELTLEDVLKIVRAEIAEHEEGVARWAAAGRSEEAADFRRQAEVVAALLGQP